MCDLIGLNLTRDKQFIFYLFEQSDNKNKNEFTFDYYF